MFLFLVIALCSVLIFYFKWCQSYWQRLGFPYVKAQTPFGALDSVIRTWKQSPGMAIYDIYKQRTKDKVVGIYLINRPALLVRDALLARNVMSKDFTSFHDRGVYVDEVHDPMSGGLFFLKGQQWKSLRTKLSPSFSSGKLRGIFGTIHDVSFRMVNYIEKKLPENGASESIEIKQLFATYAIDVIASSIFGLEVNSFEDPQNDFYALSKDVNKNTYNGVLRATLQFLCPSVEKVFKRLGFTEPAPDFMKEIVRKTIEYREKNNIVRKDLMQLLLQLRNTGKINGDEDEEWSAEGTKGALKNMSVELIAAQMFLFYLAGFETSAATAAFTLYELSQDSELLEKAKEDVQQAMEKHGSLTYDALRDMTYLELCVMETIRKYPALPILNRECTQDYTIPDTEFVIKKGTPIVISLLGIHRNEEYFPDPMRYDPERFSKENSNYDPVAYMPFGEGPRHCIAQRMGKLNVKVAIAQILTNFEIEVDPNTPEITIDNFGIQIMPKGGVPIKLSRKKMVIEC